MLALDESQSCLSLSLGRLNTFIIDILHHELLRVTSYR
jgi:hypothetical protein